MPSSTSGALWRLSTVDLGHDAVIAKLDPVFAYAPSANRCDTYRLRCAEQTAPTFTGTLECSGQFDVGLLSTDLRNGSFAVAGLLRRLVEGVRAKSASRGFEAASLLGYYSYFGTICGLAKLATQL